MKRLQTLLALATVSLGVLTVLPSAGAAAKPAAKSTAKEVKVGDKAVCCVCAVNEGGKAKPEEVKAVLKYKGKTYPFCDISEKAEFISHPGKYAKK